MRAVKSKNTKIELFLRSKLYKEGLRYRKNNKDLFGKPDISNKKRKIVIFIDSCFWHGCRKHCRMPKSNIEYWTNKIARNIKRDKEVNKHYKKLNWTIMRIWEHELGDLDKIITQISRFIILK